MKKNEQLKINSRVEEIIDTISGELWADNIEHVGQLRTCNAHVYKVGKNYLLRSYNTWVAAIFKEKAVPVFIDFLRYTYGYTNTSAQHISKFKHDFWGETVGDELTWRAIK